MLREEFPEYNKNAKNIYSSLVERLSQAKGNATRVLQYCEETDTDNPSTLAHELVNYLENIKAV